LTSINSDLRDRSSSFLRFKIAPEIDSMTDDARWQTMMRGLRDGDQQAECNFFKQYGEAMHRLADRYLGAKLRRRVGAEDIVQSACRTFLRRAQGGEFQLPDTEALWRLLCAITLSKVREQARYHGRQKRGFDKEVPLPAQDTSSAAGWDPVDPDPSPAQAVAFTEQLEQLLATLDEEERQIVDLKLQDLTNEAIAERLGSSERTVRRIMKRLQTKLAGLLAV
jgi:RNA polymerase sigma-70 factor, ECF subfamily